MANFCKHCGHKFGDDWRQEHPEDRIVRTDNKPDPIVTDDYEELI